MIIVHVYDLVQTGPLCTGTGSSRHCKFINHRGGWKAAVKVAALFSCTVSAKCSMVIL